MDDNENRGLMEEIDEILNLGRRMRGYDRII